jgi:hypothetical protein
LEDVLLNPTLRVFIPDSTYPDSGEGEEAEKASREFKAALEIEFGLSFEDDNIGPGFDIPAFVASIDWGLWPLGAAALALFFSGKTINENLEAWPKIAKKLGSMFKKKPTFEREGAAIIAVDEVLRQTGSKVIAVTLLGYSTLHIGDLENSIKLPDSIDDNIPSINLGLYVHVFHLQADEKRFLVVVDGHKVQVTNLSKR